MSAGCFLGLVLCGLSALCVVWILNALGVVGVGVVLLGIVGLGAAVLVMLRRERSAP